MGLFSKPEVISPGGDGGDYKRIGELEQRVARLELQVTQLVQGVQTSQSGPAQTWMTEVQELRRAGKVIHAIKLYREHTGVGLKEAKDAVDSLPV